MDTHEIVLKDRRVPMCEEVERALLSRSKGFDWASPYIIFSYRTREPMDRGSISRIVREALNQEEALSNITLTDLRHDFIVRQLETHDWAYVARITGFTASAFQASYSPYIKIKNLEQRELQGDDEYRIWRILQNARGTTEGLALALRWYMNLSLVDMVALTWDQVDLENRMLHLPKGDLEIPHSVREYFSLLYQKRGEGEDPHVLLKEHARTPLDVSYLSRLVRTVLLQGGVDNIMFRDTCKDPKNKTDKAKILDFAKANPGFIRHDALEALGMSRTTLYRLISDLLDEKKLDRVGMMYYLSGTVVPEEEQYEVICDFLKENGTATIGDLHFILRIERRQCGRILNKMVKDGKLTRTGNHFSLPLEATTKKKNQSV